MNRDANAPQLRWTSFVPDNLDTGWMSRGLCTKIGNYDDWYPEGGQAIEASEAIAACQSCSVREQCLAYALTIEINQDGTPLSAGSRYGIFGGLNAASRARVARGEPEKIVATHCQHGHPFTEDNIRIEKRGDRTCRACELRRRARQARDSAKVTCTDCGHEMTRKALSRHRKRWHREDAA